MLKLSRLNKIFQMAALILFTQTGSAQAQQTAVVSEAFRWKAKIVEEQAPNTNGIPFLKWAKEDVLVETTAFLHFTDIMGRFSEPIKSATLNSKPIPLREDGSFDVHFGFPGESKSFLITVIDEQNRIYRAKYIIIPFDHQEVVLSKIGPRRWRFSSGAGITNLSFRQKNVVPFRQYAVTVKASATYRITPEKFDLGISAFYNLVPFSSDSPAGYKIQYLGVNGRITVNLIGAPSPLRLNLSGGVYFNTSVSQVGFANMYGPQLYPELIYVFENGHSILFYGKYSPALSQKNLLNISENREIAFGVHYSYPITFSNRLSVGFDTSQLNLSVPGGDWASTNTYSLSAGISF